MLTWLRHNMFHFNRDSKLWLLLMVGGLLTFLGAEWGAIQEAFPGLDPLWHKRIELLSGLVATMSALARMSPIDGLSERGRRRLMAAKRRREGIVDLHHHRRHNDGAGGADAEEGDTD